MYANTDDVKQKGKRIPTTTLWSPSTILTLTLTLTRTLKPFFLIVRKVMFTTERGSHSRCANSFIKQKTSLFCVFFNYIYMRWNWICTKNKQHLKICYSKIQSRQRVVPFARKDQYQASDRHQCAWKTPPASKCEKRVAFLERARIFRSLYYPGVKSVRFASSKFK